MTVKEASERSAYTQGRAAIDYTDTDGTRRQYRSLSGETIYRRWVDARTSPKGKVAPAGWSAWVAAYLESPRQLRIPATLVPISVAVTATKERP